MKLYLTFYVKALACGFQEFSRKTRVSEKGSEKEIDSDDSLHTQKVRLEDALSTCNTIKQHIIRSTIYCKSDEKTLTLIRALNFSLLRPKSFDEAKYPQCFC